MNVGNNLKRGNWIKFINAIYNYKAFKELTCQVGNDIGL